MLNKKLILAEVGAAISLAWAMALWAGDPLVREQTFEQIRIAVGRGLLLYVTVDLIFETLRQAYRQFASRSSPRLRLAGVAWRVALAIFIGFGFRTVAIELLPDFDFVGAGPSASILATVWAVVIAAGWALPRPADQPNPAWNQRVEGRTLAWMLAGFTGFVVLAYFQDEWAISSFLWRLLERDLLMVLFALVLAIDLHKKRQAFLRRSGVSPHSLPPEQDAAMSGAGS